MANEETSKKGGVPPVETKELVTIRQALAAKHGLHLRPGESLSIDATRDEDHAFVGVVLAQADGTYRVELEAAVLEGDPHEGETSAKSRFDAALDFVDLQLAEFFADDRDSRFHLDYRIYDFGPFKVRFRGQQLRPDLESLADAWLNTGGDPEASSDEP